MNTGSDAHPESLYAKKADIAYRAVLAGYLLQYLLIVVSTLWLVPTHKQPSITICIMSMLPLLILLPWILRRSIRAHIWLCFLMLGYFLPAVQHAFMHEQYGWLPLIEIANAVCLYVAAMLFARWEQRRLQISVTR